MKGKTLKTIGTALGYIFIGLVFLAIVVFPVLAFQQSSEGAKNCAAKHGTTEVIWSYPDKCYVKK